MRFRKNILFYFDLIGCGSKDLVQITLIWRSLKEFPISWPNIARKVRIS